MEAAHWLKQLAEIVQPLESCWMEVHPSMVPMASRQRVTASMLFLFLVALQVLSHTHFGTALADANTLTKKTDDPQRADPFHVEP